MIKYFKWTSLLIFFSLFSFLKSQGQQLKSFTTDPAKFFEEMQAYLAETNKDDAEMLMAEFRMIWETGAVLEPKASEQLLKHANEAMQNRLKDKPDALITPYTGNNRKLTSTQQQDVYKTANTMLKKRMKAFPDFSNYLYALMSFAGSTQSDESFQKWQASIDKLLKGTNRNFARFINTCNTLFASNTLFVSISTKWVSSNNNYSFDFDSLPKIIFPDLNLICRIKGDSSVIFKTAGVYYPNKELWYGKGGKVTWARAALSPEKVYAELKKYKVDISGSEYAADSVVFYNSNFFAQPLVGKFTDKILADVKPETASYPRFQSYNVLFEIKNIVDNADYKGGFSMSGSHMIGSGKKDADATISFYRDKKLFLFASSQHFVISDDKITSDIAKVTFHLDKDSIYHPGVGFKYIKKDKELSLIRNEEGISKSPFFNSFHKMDMFFDALNWKQSESSMHMKMLSASGLAKASFESSDFYKEERFQRLQGVSDMNPLSIIKQFSKEKQLDDFYVTELASYMHMQASQVRSLVLMLTNMGFLIYDLTTDKAKIKDRLFYYIDAKLGRTDYDVIRIESLISSQNNASINLVNNDITIRGVSQIFLSDSQKVYIVPKNQEIVMKRNREFYFGGLVHASRYDFYGKDFSFDYDNFKINLNNVDSLRLKVIAFKPDENGRKPFVPVKSVLQNITGDLLIDHPKNKSGVKSLAQYPIFNSHKDSYVFYDKANIQKGVYNKEKFYFHLEPFTIDSLDNFTNAGIAFKGEFISAGIFPDINDTLRLMPDYSLGISRPTPAEGLPIYGNKGVFYSKIKLSNEGLRGDGSIDFISAKVKSDDFIFMPDSMKAVAQEFNIEKGIKDGIEYPQVKGLDVFIRWLPYRDRMTAFKRKIPLDFYESQAKLDGSASLSSKGLTGNGTMSFVESKLQSSLFKYKQDVFGADTSTFRLNSGNDTTLAFSTTNVKSTIDFINRTGEFKSNGGGSFVSFPINQYICFIDQFKWFMDKKEVEINSGETVDPSQSDIDLSGSEFISVHPQQDSLRFKALSAKYSLADNIIKAEKVKQILVADATIYPGDGLVTIEKKAKLQTLNQASIKANNTTAYHNFYSALVNIYGRKYYEASGMYDFVAPGLEKQKIKLGKIAVDSSLQTYGRGELFEGDNFKLTPQVMYKGKVNVYASRKFPEYFGFGKLDHFCMSISNRWFKFTGEVDPEQVTIPVNEPKDDNNEKLYAGILFNSDSSRVYSAFLSKKSSGGDKELMQANGFLSYDNASQTFKIAAKDKLLNNKIPGNAISLDSKSCSTKAEGNFFLGPENEQFKIVSAGESANDLGTKSLTLDLLMGIQFPFNDDALKIFSDAILAVNNLQPTNDTRPEYETGLANIIGKEKAEKVISELNLYGALKKVPSELKFTMFFSDLKFKWNDLSNSFTTTDNLGLALIEKTTVNRFVKGNIEIIRKKSGNTINIYIEPDEKNWFFFSYQKGILQVYASDEKFNALIRDMKPEKRASEGDKGVASFQYMLSTEKKKSDFLKRVSYGGDY